MVSHNGDPVRFLLPSRTANQIKESVDAGESHPASGKLESCVEIVYEIKLCPIIIVRK